MASSGIRLGAFDFLKWGDIRGVSERDFLVILLNFVDYLEQAVHATLRFWNH
jgi:hypothetical protein